MLICPLPRCCRAQVRHAQHRRVENCIKSFDKYRAGEVRAGRMPEDEDRAYDDRLRVWEEKIVRDKQRGEMREIASEQVDWWGDSDSEPGTVPFGLFQPERATRKRRSGPI